MHVSVTVERSCSGTVAVMVAVTVVPGTCSVCLITRVVVAVVVITEAWLVLARYSVSVTVTLTTDGSWCEYPDRNSVTVTVRRCVALSAEE